MDEKLEKALGVNLPKLAGSFIAALLDQKELPISFLAQELGIPIDDAARILTGDTYLSFEQREVVMDSLELTEDAINDASILDDLLTEHSTTIWQAAHTGKWPHEASKMLWRLSLEHHNLLWRIFILYMTELATDIV